jgi:putative DNA primase/helicase
MNHPPILSEEERQRFDQLAASLKLQELNLEGKGLSSVGPISLEQRTEVAAAKVLVHCYGKDIRYCERLGGWYLWDGSRWKRDDDGGVFRLAEALTPIIVAYSNRIADPEQQQKVFRFAISLNNKRRLQNVVAVAGWQAGIAIGDPAAFDSNAWLFNVRNGTIDLREGLLRPHNREDLITKLSPVEYNQNAKCERWERFLDEVFAGDTERCEFIRRAVGYSLTGDNREHAFFVLHGFGANGKTTFVDTVVEVLGDYGTTASPETFLDRRSGAPTNDLARLRGARFVSTIETGDRQSLAESFVKAVTGGDRVTARFLYAEFFDFEPVFKLCLASNHKPVIKGADEGIWRRVRLVPFLERFDGERADRHLREKLKAELPGILTWAVRGCLDWQKDGLKPPASVTGATADYRSEMDVFSGFLEERCVMDPEGREAAGALYAAYRSWADKNGEKALSQRWFGLRLSERGFQHKTTAGRKWWRGIRLRGDADSSETLSDVAVQPPRAAETSCENAHARAHITEESQNRPRGANHVFTISKGDEGTHCHVCRTSWSSHGRPPRSMWAEIAMPNADELFAHAREIGLMASEPPLDS